MRLLWDHFSSTYRTHSLGRLQEEVKTKQEHLTVCSTPLPYQKLLKMYLPVCERLLVCCRWVLCRAVRCASEEMWCLSSSRAGELPSPRPSGQRSRNICQVTAQKACCLQNSSSKKFQPLALSESLTVAVATFSLLCRCTIPVRFVGFRAWLWFSFIVLIC